MDHRLFILGEAMNGMFSQEEIHWSSILKQFNPKNAI